MTEKPRLNLLDLSMIVIGLVIGMGIFRTASDAANASLTPAIYFSAWIIGGLIALCGALTYAEIGSRFPVIGGYYKVFAYAYHPSIAFALNCSILISNAASIAGVTLIGADYITKVFLPDAPGGVSIAIAIGSILLFYGVNLIGLKMSSKTQNVLMVIKIFMLLLLISALFWPTAYAENNVPLMTRSEGSWMDIISSFGLALIAVSFTYGGYQQTINFGSEVKDAPRTIPRAIFIGITAIILLYLVTNVAYYNIIGFTELQNPENRQIASIVVGKMFGQQGADAFSLLLFISVLAYVNVTLLSNPRVMFAMSEDGILPGVFQKRSTSRGVYYVALTTFAAIAMVVVFFAETFEKILSFSIFLDSFGMALSAATIFIFRKRTRHLDNKGIYKMKLYPLMPILFILAYLFVSISIAVNTPDIALIGTGVLIGFTLLYFVIRRREPKET